MKWAPQKQDDEDALKWGGEQTCAEIYLTSKNAFIKVSRRAVTEKDPFWEVKIGSCLKTKQAAQTGHESYHC